MLPGPDRSDRDPWKLISVTREVHPVGVAGPLEQPSLGIPQGVPEGLRSG